MHNFFRPRRNGNSAGSEVTHRPMAAGINRCRLIIPKSSQRYHTSFYHRLLPGSQGILSSYWRQCYIILVGEIRFNISILTGVKQCISEIGFRCYCAKRNGFQCFSPPSVDYYYMHQLWNYIYYISIKMYQYCSTLNLCNPCYRFRQTLLHRLPRFRIESYQYNWYRYGKYISIAHAGNYN